jgi:hypothetical protein
MESWGPTQEKHMKTISMITASGRDYEESARKLRLVLTWLLLVRVGSSISGYLNHSHLEVREMKGAELS